MTYNYFHYNIVYIEYDYYFLLFGAWAFPNPLQGYPNEYGNTSSVKQYEVYAS